jgi:hypothetical protein
VWWFLTFIVFCCGFDLFVWVWWFLTTQDNKRQTQPHPNKQINNTTQDNKCQTPQHPKKQIKQRNTRQYTSDTTTPKQTNQ